MNYVDRYDWTTGGPYDGNAGGSTASYLARTPGLCLFNTFGSKGAFRLPGRRGITAVVRWNLRPVIFGVQFITRVLFYPKLFFVELIVRGNPVSHFVDRLFLG